MGLDMYLYRCAKPTHSKLTEYFEKSDIDDDPSMFCDTFMKFARIIKKKDKRWDVDKINKTFGVEVDHIYANVPFVCVQYTNDGVRFICNNNTTIFIDKKDILKFTYDEEKEVYAIDLIEVAYQRKGLNDTGLKLIPENLSYSDNKKRIEKMVRLGGLSKQFIEKWVDGETVFHPSW